MRAERERLIQECLGDETRRRGHVEAGVRVLRRRRVWRRVRVGASTVLAVVVAMVGLKLGLRHPGHRSVTLALAPAAVARAQPQALTDEQLLALFPNTPVALATLADGKKRLIFPRPEDQHRFVRSP